MSYTFPSSTTMGSGSYSKPDDYTADARSRLMQRSGPVNIGSRVGMKPGGIKELEENWQRKASELINEHTTLMLQKDDEIRHIKEAFERYRLSIAGQAETSAQKYQGLEDINIPIRPSTIADDYKQFMEGHRITFIDKLGASGVDDSKGYDIALNIFEYSYSVANDALTKYEEDIMVLLVNPLQLRLRQKQSIVPATEMCKDDIGSYLKRIVDAVDITPIVEKVKANSMSDKRICKYLERNISHANQYITECVELCCKMVVQTPKLKIYLKDIKDQPRDRYRRRCLCKVNRCNADKYIWPILCEERTVLVKGEVNCRIK